MLHRRLCSAIVLLLLIVPGVLFADHSTQHIVDGAVNKFLTPYSTEKQITILTTIQHKVEQLSLKGRSQEWIELFDMLRYSINAKLAQVKLHQAPSTHMMPVETSYVTYFRTGTPSQADSTDERFLTQLQGPVNMTERENLMKIINATRVRDGKKELARHDQLARIAQTHADNMTMHDYFAHEGPDGESFLERVRHSGYSYRYISENIALAYSPEQVVQLRTDSADHQKNMLNSVPYQIGVGYNSRGNYRVAIFGKGK